MIRDPLYNAIVQGLQGTLDKEAFERCAQVLLKTLYPRLVPIRGGSDGGFDGVTAELEGNEIALVVTAGKNVLRNLRTSLTSILKDGRPIRRAISATSQALSPPRQKALANAAEKLGFQLFQVYEQAWFADSLYGNPAWRKELLGISGKPPPLAAVARTNRPAITSELVGHAEELEWLTAAEGDRLLIGQPGSGKSFLLAQAAKANGWLFVVSRDPESIADGIRAQQPSGLILDDAHAEPDFLCQLAQLRTSIHVDIPIIATCWPGAKSEIAELLHLTDSHQRELQRLTRPEIASILDAAGLQHAEHLVYQILNQAEGRPGLAVTLAHLCINGNQHDLERVVLGDALLDTTRTTFKDLVGPNSIEVLAALSVGGATGMRMQDVSRFLGSPLVEIRSMLVSLAAGGIIHDENGECFSVRPRELRYALTKEVFFNGAASLDINPLLALSPNIHDTAEVVIRTSHYGAEVSRELMRNLLAVADRPSLWKDFAWLGSAECQWALDQRPDLQSELIQPALELLPDTAIPFLLATSIGDARALHSHPGHSLRVIEDWIGEAFAGSPAALLRRRTVHAAGMKWLAGGSDHDAGLFALAAALKPWFRAHHADPVLGNNVTVRWGLLRTTEIDELSDLWETTIAFVGTINVKNWGPLLQVLGDWVYPQRHAPGGVEKSVYERFHQESEKILRKLSELGEFSPGLAHAVADFAGHLGIELSVKVDPDFEAVPSIQTDRADVDEQSRKIRDLARQYASRRPAAAVNRILELQHLAQSVDVQNRMPNFVAEVAELVTDPSEWLDLLMSANVSGDIVSPFLSRATRLRSQNWEGYVMRCLSADSMRSFAVGLVLQLENPPPCLLDMAMRNLTGVSSLIEHLCWANSITVPTLRQLFQHEDDSIASHAALGIWQNRDTKPIPDELVVEWRAAVLRSDRNEFWFGKLAEEQPDIAFEWLLATIQRNEGYWSRHQLGLKGALSAVSTEHRKQLLLALSGNFWSSDMVEWLVRGDPLLYADFLGMPQHKRFHTAPLGGHPNPNAWTEMAKVAVHAGIPPETIAEAAFRRTEGWSGKESDHFAEWVTAFESLSTTESDEICRIRDEGIKIAARRRDDALRQERNRDTFGRP